MTLHHRRLNKLAAGRAKRRASSFAVVRAKNIQHGNIDRDIAKILRPNETDAQRETFMKNRALFAVMGRNDAESIHSLTKLGLARLDMGMTKRGWDVVEGARGFDRYVWSTAE